MQIRINLSLPKNPDGTTRAGIVLADIQYRSKRKLTADELAKDVLKLLNAGKAAVRAAREILKEQRRQRKLAAGGKTPTKAPSKAPTTVPVPIPEPSLAPAPFRVPVAPGELDPPSHSESPGEHPEEGQESTGLSPGARAAGQNLAKAGVAFSIGGALGAAAALASEYGWVLIFAL